MTRDLVIKQGATYEATIEYVDAADEPIPLTGYVARMQIRDCVADDDGEIVFEATDEELIVQEDVGRVLIVVSAERTEAIRYGRYVYDIELINEVTGRVISLLSGKVNVMAEVTRAA